MYWASVFSGRMPVRDRIDVRPVAAWVGRSSSLLGEVTRMALGRVVHLGGLGLGLPECCVVQLLSQECVRDLVHGNLPLSGVFVVCLLVDVVAFPLGGVGVSRWLSGFVGPRWGGIRRLGRV